VYARLTGWGQQGPFAPMAGHDIDYIALSGALSTIGRRGERPVPPVNLLGDFAGGGMLCAFGIVLALFERCRSGKGQIIDSAMVDGAANLATFLYGFRAAGLWSCEHGTNLLDTGAPFYDTYETADGKYMAVGAIEPQFYAELLRGLDLDPDVMPHQMDREAWPETRKVFAERFRSRTRDEWCAVFDGTDACVAPVLDLDEAPKHPHNVARSTFVGGPKDAPLPAPAPRLSRTPGRAACDAPLPGQHSREIFSELGLSEEEIEEGIKTGAIG
ncbi:MAG: CoA transferase, partial [Deltaproteobacteria bacterium]